MKIQSQPKEYWTREACDERYKCDALPLEPMENLDLDEQQEELRKEEMMNEETAAAENYEHGFPED